MSTLGWEEKEGDSHCNEKGCADIHKSHKTGQRSILEPWHGDTPAWGHPGMETPRHGDAGL